LLQPIRLNRYLASAGVASRRQCDALIRDGHVTVNGLTITELGTRVTPDVDQVLLDGAPVEAQAAAWCLVLHKPKDVLVAARDPRGRRTVMDLLADFEGRVFPVGRLDFRSEGLLVFTNDGELAFRLAHPRFKVEKVYRVEVSGAVPPGVVRALRKGVVLEDGPTQPAGVRILSSSDTGTTLEFSLREGRKRQIRRMLSLFGFPVERLVRVRFGPIELGELPEGAWRLLDAEETHALRTATGLVAPVRNGGGT
jgi:23S rRNA pseudouridine2605 synthase